MPCSSRVRSTIAVPARSVPRSKGAPDAPAHAQRCAPRCAASDGQPGRWPRPARRPLLALELQSLEQIDRVTVRRRPDGAGVTPRREGTEHPPALNLLLRRVLLQRAGRGSTMTPLASIRIARSSKASWSSNSSNSRSSSTRCASTSWCRNAGRHRRIRRQTLRRGLVWRRRFPAPGGGAAAKLEAATPATLGGYGEVPNSRTFSTKARHSLHGRRGIVRLCAGGNGTPARTSSTLQPERSRLLEQAGGAAPAGQDWGRSVPLACLPACLGGDGQAKREGGQGAGERPETLSCDRGPFPSRTQAGHGGLPCRAPRCARARHHNWPLATTAGQGQPRRRHAVRTPSTPVRSRRWRSAHRASRARPPGAGPPGGSSMTQAAVRPVTRVVSPRCYRQLRGPSRP